MTYLHTLDPREVTRVVAECNPAPADALDYLPDGWVVLQGTLTQPRGYVWISNNKSIFSKDYKRLLMKL